MYDNWQNVKLQSAAPRVHWLVLVQGECKHKCTDRKSCSCRSLDLPFWMQTCALLTFMSLKCSDTERWSHWQRPGFPSRELLECGPQRVNTKATCAVMRDKDLSGKINVNIWSADSDTDVRLLIKHKRVSFYKDCRDYMAHRARNQMTNLAVVSR